MDYAGFWKRVGASIIDTLLTGLFGLLMRPQSAPDHMKKEDYLCDTGKGSEQGSLYPDRITEHPRW